MERIVEQAYLYDFYGELLTEHQRQIYEDFVLNDLSFSEIAEERGVSRQGIHDIVRRCDKILAQYESKLHLVEKFLLTRQKAEKIHELIQEGIKDPENDTAGQLKQIEQIVKSILDSL